MELEQIRSEIDRVDEGMLQLFLERIRLAEQVASLKREKDLPIVNKAREREVLSRVQQNSGDMEPYAYQLFSTMMELSKARQEELLARPSPVRALVEKGLSRAQEVFPRTGTVACQGVEGGNSQAACDKMLPRGNIVYVKTFDAVVNAVESGLCQYGVLPIENSSNGSVRAVYELLTNHRVSVVRSANLFIRHVLLAKPGVKLQDVKEVLSHEQALGQCSKFFAAYSGIKATACLNTAAAAQLVAESGRSDLAAIASPECAKLYGLEVIGESFQDSDNNYTRFICIAREPAVYAGSNRISLIIACANKPGALNEILSKLAVRGINMTKLESCPVSGRNFEFMFFLELDASVQEQGVVTMLEELERCCQSFLFLGCYAMV